MTLLSDCKYKSIFHFLSYLPLYRESIIMELERQENILIISHQAVLRCIYGYFMNIPHKDIPYINIPLHTVIQVRRVLMMMMM